MLERKTIKNFTCVIVWINILYTDSVYTITVRL